MKTSPFLPMTIEDMDALGWSELDFLCVTGDAYVDHPSFGTAIVARVLESLGYRVGVVAQPAKRGVDEIARMGRPRLGVLVASGNMDSMVANCSARGRRRKIDAYSPDGEAGRRPDRAVITYCNLVREAWKDLPILIGGIEASLRRLAHYDYWSDSVRRSVLVDSRADILTYGMSELQITEIARRLANGERAADIRGVPGTCWRAKAHEVPDDAVRLPSFDEVSSDKRAYAAAFCAAYGEQNFYSGKPVAQDQGAWYVVCEPPARPLSTRELDAVYDLPYTRRAHPYYRGADVPATREVSFSITGHRGCFGECAFCAIASHQGRVIQARSLASIEREARILTKMPDFKGYIHDIGGPSANFRTPSCAKSVKYGACRDRSCLFPTPCEHLDASHADLLKVLRAVRSLPGVKKVFVRSGLRYDYILHADDGRDFLDELCRYHVSGQLKIAPEHASRAVLARMRKCPPEMFGKFADMYAASNVRAGLRQFLVPYFMTSHPGCGLREALELALYIHERGTRSEQVQDFTPTPGSLSSCMYWCEMDPYTGERLHVAKDDRERAMQRALLQYWMPENAKLAAEALRLLGRGDLIGGSKKCLVRNGNERRASRRA